MTCTLQLQVCESNGRAVPLDVAIDQVILIGYSGRDRAAVDAHIRELEALGVAPPDRVPAIYNVSPDLVTTGSVITVGGQETSGEAEFVLIPTADDMFVAAGSDHTDRHHERIDIAASKALCGKVISREVWRLATVEPHWDSLELRAWTTSHAGRALYQEGRLATLLAPRNLLAVVERAGLPVRNVLIFGGTLPTLGRFAFGQRFDVELRDPIRNRQLQCAYDVVVRA